DVLFAAALLHDVGAFLEFQDHQNPGMDHSIRSTQVVGDVLKTNGFPMYKIELVKKAILHHMYNDPTAPSTPEGIVLHNADTIDFLGAIGTARIFSIVGKEIPTFDIAFSVLREMSDSIKYRLYAVNGSFTSELGEKRATETKTFLFGLSVSNAKVIKEFTESLVVESFSMLGN
ncbi:MAG: HD domain-containing protein, partial [Bacteriovorax sp.]